MPPVDREVVGDGSRRTEPMTDCRHFPPVLASVAQTRRFVAELLVSEPSEIVEMVQLIASELATNCIVHTATEFDVCVTRDDNQIKVEVTDRSDGVPILRHPGLDEPTGRGLMIATALASDWGVATRDGKGTTVWFTVSRQL